MSTSLFLNFLRHPTQVGAVCPSSRALSCAITDFAGIGQFPQTVVELGPGTGVFTREILQRQKSCGGRFLALEINGDLCRNLRQTLPELELYQEDAARLPLLLQEKGLEYADVVVAGLPWAIFPEDLQERLLDVILDVMSDDGLFVTYAYVVGALMPAGLRFRKCLKKKFGIVEQSSIIWQNMPPAFVYRCRK